MTPQLCCELQKPKVFVQLVVGVGQLKRRKPSH
jgi:hypothetical protein